MTDERFWQMVQTGEGCWLWLGYRDTRGYGRLSRAAVHKAPILAHRYSWMLAHGRMPTTDEHVCHRCDNPPCVNPDHLFLGDAKVNSDDKWAKGRATLPPYFSGESHPSAVVPDALVEQARWSYALGQEFQHEIAERLGVSQSLVGAWVRGDIRREAGGPIAPRRKRATRAEMAARRAA